MLPVIAVSGLMTSPYQACFTAGMFGLGADMSPDADWQSWYMQVSMSSVTSHGVTNTCWVCRRQRA